MEDTKIQQPRLIEITEPIIQGGLEKTVVSNLSNPTTKEFAYEVELYLTNDVEGKNVAASSGSGVVSIPAGGVVPTQFTFVAPFHEGVYYMFISVRVDGVQIALFKADKQITVEVVPDINIDYIGADRVDSGETE